MEVRIHEFWACLEYKNKHQNKVKTQKLPGVFGWKYYKRIKGYTSCGFEGHGKNSAFFFLSEMRSYWRNRSKNMKWLHLLCHRMTLGATSRAGHREDRVGRPFGRLCSNSHEREGGLDEVLAAGVAREVASWACSMVRFRAFADTVHIGCGRKRSQGWHQGRGLQQTGRVDLPWAEMKAQERVNLGTGKDGERS